MKLESTTEIELALTRVGDQLAFESQQISVVVLGGAALNLLGLVSRATSDVDIIAQNASQDFHVILDELMGHLKGELHDLREEGPH